MKKHNNKITLVSIVSDILVIILAFSLAVNFVEEIKPIEENTKMKSLLLFLIINIWYISGSYNRIYKEYYRKKTFILLFLKTIKNISIQAIVVVVFLFFFPGVLPKSFLFYFISFLTAILIVEKYIFNKAIYSLRKRGFNLRNVVILGLGIESIQFSKLFAENPHMGYKLLGYLDDEVKNSNVGKHLGRILDLPKILEKNYINEIIITSTKFSPKEIDEITKAANYEGVRVRIIPDFHYNFKHYNFKQFGNIPTIILRKEPLDEIYNRLFKRIFDIFFSLGVIIFICSWLFPIIGLIIKTTSKGPIFFKQLRLGRDRQEFMCYKFRSMAKNDESDKIQATKNDSRVTKIGKFLRKTSLDELPQFWNVLLGNMSVVGPRPHMLKHNDEYRNLIDDYLVRQLVKPGITGWAQINGYRGEIEEYSDIQNRVTYDIWYIENWKFLLDLKIIFLTIWNVVKGEDKAY